MVCKDMLLAIYRCYFVPNPNPAPLDMFTMDLATLGSAAIGTEFRGQEVNLSYFYGEGGTVLYLKYFLQYYPRDS